MTADRPDPVILDAPGIVHGSAVALGPRGALIIGPSGTGKSALALTLMAYGATLVADDRVEVVDRDGLPWLSCPRGITGLIEARHIGLLRAEAAAGAWLTLVVDLAHVETDRLPPARTAHVLGDPFPLLHKVETAHFAPGILQFLKSGRLA
jgi:HPr kinase/phosphorylase